MFKINPDNECMFKGLNKCGSDTLNFTRIMCKKHAQDIFNIRTQPFVLLDKEYHNKTIAVYTDNSGCGKDVLIAPMPFKLKDNTSRVANDYSTATHTLCIDENSVADSVTSFIASKNLESRGYTQHQKRAIIETIVLYITDNTFQNSQLLTSTTMDASSSYSIFKAQNGLRLATYYDSGYTVTIVNEDSRTVTWPICKLPIFYQALLIHFELSEHQFPLEQGRNTRAILPNIIINFATKSISAYNETVELPIYRYSEKTSFASPLILTGTVIHRSRVPHNFHEKAQPISGVYGTNSRPVICN